jgi:hypothetical protein
MDYAIYAPTVTTVEAINPYTEPSGLTYVSNSSLAYYGGKYWAVMDGNVGGLEEGDAGQQIWLTTSTDGVTWTTAVQPFRDSTYCNNPLTGSAIEWQPNLVVVGAELWCTWSGSDAYISKLTTSTGKWTNYRFEFSGTSVYMSSTITGRRRAGIRCAPPPAGLMIGAHSRRPTPSFSVAVWWCARSPSPAPPCPRKPPQHPRSFGR